MSRLFQRVFLFAIVLGLMTAGMLTAGEGGKEKSKTFSINLGSAIKAGKVMLKPGQYNLMAPPNTLLVGVIRSDTS